MGRRRPEKSEDGSRSRFKRDNKFEFRNPGNKRQARAKRLGLDTPPSAKEVALAVKGGHISRAEARELNRHYIQWVKPGEKIKSPPRPAKEKKTKGPKKTRNKPKVLSRGKRVINGKTYKVTKIAEDTAKTASLQQEQRKPRPIGRGKGSAV